MVQYGNQDVENPDKVNYDARVNYRKDELTNVEVTVKPDENQEIIGVKDVRLLSDYKPFTVVRNLTEDEYTWDKDKITIKKPLLKDEMLTFSYTTKIVKPVSDEKVHSVVELKSDNLQWDYNAEVYLVTGSGHGAGDKENPVDPVEPRGSESTETSTTETSTTETSTTETSTTETSTTETSTTETSTTETSTTETSTTEVVTTEDSSAKESETTTVEQKDDSLVVLEPKSTEAELPNTGTDASTITITLGTVFAALGGLVVRKKKN